MEFPLPLEAAENAARRELRDELGLTGEQPPIELLDSLKFHAVDHESLYFFLFALALPRSVRPFPPSSQIRPWALADLLQLRRHQALSYAEQLVGRATLTARQADLAARALKSNLVLHDLGQLGAALSDHLYQQERHADLRDELRWLREQSALPHPAAEGGLIQGLGRLQYREFFSSLLPLYARIGVPGASEELARIRMDPAKEAALAELRELYRDELSMRDLATEV